MIDLDKISKLTGFVDKLIQLKGIEDTLDEEKIAGLIQDAINFTQATYSKEEIDAARRDLTWRYEIQTSPGASILSDYEEDNFWYDDVKSGIEPKFWTRYKNYLIDEKHFSPNVVSTLGEDTLDQKLMNYILDPNANYGKPVLKRGLIIGDVQSGKTSTYRTVDNYLETNKDSAKKQTGFWYKAGGYKLDIVPYSIAKILHSIPKGYTLNWDYIWNHQMVSPAFMREIELVTKMTNDFICDSHGIIVTEYCKKEDTWVAFRDTVSYTPSDRFIDELMPEGLVKEQEESAQKEQKGVDDLKYVMQIIEPGAEYWQKLFVEGVKRGALKYSDQTWLKQAMEFASKGDIPCSSSGKVPYKTMTMAMTVMEIKERLESLGIKI